VPDGVAKATTDDDAAVAQRDADRHLAFASFGLAHAFNRVKPGFPM